MRKTLLFLLITSSIAFAASSMKTIYKVTKLSPTVLGISCPLNNADPTVVKNISGVLLVSCGTFDPSVLLPK